MSDGITRERLRHELAVRRITVTATTDIAPGMRRVTFTGPDLRGFTAPGPADHVKLFFPDPATGILSVPAAGQFKTPAPEGERRIVRDYSPAAFRDHTDTPELDIDFVLHGPAGIASSWAEQVAVGQQLAIGGPRGSALLPTGIESLVIIADETAYPATQRWIDAVDPGTPITALLISHTPGTPAAYFAADADRLAPQVFGNDEAGAASLAAALGAITPTANTYFFLAGEAKSLIPLRRYLRRELNLPKTQVEVHGYWKRGVIALDHHAPLDPTDPDE